MTVRRSVHRTMLQPFNAGTLISEAPPPCELNTPEVMDAEGKPRLPQVGDILGGCYRLVRKLGEGRFGQVYVAERTDVPEHRVALKVMSRAVYAGRNVDRELVMLAAASHPHIVQLKDHGTTDNLVWLTMPLYEGETLEERLARGNLSLREAYEIFVPIARGLQSLHDRGLRHQDVKPDNVFLAQFGGQLHSMVLDLGVAVEKSATFVAGTALFAAPEQLAALGSLAQLAPLSEKIDSYCLASTLLRSLVGAANFPGEEARSPLQVADSFDERAERPLRPAALHALAGEPRRQLEAAFQRWLCKEPEQRPSAGDLANELDVLLAQEREATLAIERSMTDQKASLRRVRVALGAAAFVGAAAALFGFSKRETLRLADELQHARAAGAESFDKLDTCVAAHQLSQQSARSCVAEQRSAAKSHQSTLKNIVRDHELAFSGMVRKFDRGQVRLRSCRDDRRDAQTQYDDDKARWEQASASLQKDFETQQRAWQDSNTRQQQALTSCEETQRQSVAAEAVCQTELANVSSAKSSCDEQLTNASSANQQCEQRLQALKTMPTPAVPGAAPASQVTPPAAPAAASSPKAGATDATPTAGKPEAPKADKSNAAAGGPASPRSTASAKETARSHASKEAGSAPPKATPGTANQTASSAPQP